ncbi:MAG: OmpA family protein [Desulfuromonadaceae bacterium]|nr:OmpA family protein [Desulfuromonadaceae bacterium]
MPVKSWSIATLVLLVPLASHATDIRQRPFSYSLEAAVAKADDQFVVCSDCLDNRLSRMPVAPKLALRISAPSTPEVPATPETQKVQTTNKDQSGVKQVRLVPIQFDFDSAKLSIPEREKLNGLLANLPRSSTLDVTGFTCTIGRSDYNEELSIRRANHVAEIIKINGLNVGTIEGKGKCCPVSNEKRLNRRVEILEHQKEEL